MVAKKKQKISAGYADLSLKFKKSNMFVTIVDSDTGKPYYTTSVGANGFKGKKKVAPFAANQTINTAINYLTRDLGVKNVKLLKVSGINNTREGVLSICKDSVSSLALKIDSIEEATPIPHGGVRLRKRRKI